MKGMLIVQAALNISKSWSEARPGTEINGILTKSLRQFDLIDLVLLLLVLL